MAHIHDAQIVQFASEFTIPPINAGHQMPVHSAWPEKTTRHDSDRAFPSTENVSPRSSFSTLMEVMSHQRSSLPLPPGFHSNNNLPNTFSHPIQANSNVKFPPHDLLPFPSCATQSSSPQFRSEPSSNALDLTTISNTRAQENIKKILVKNHPLMPRMKIFLESVRKDCFAIPSAFAHQDSLQEEDFSLDSFLMAQGFDEFTLNDPEHQLTEEQEEDKKLFLQQINQVKAKYDKEIEYLDSVASKAISDAESILNAQTAFRPQLVVEEEKVAKKKSIIQKFEGLKTALRQQACGSILVLQKKYHIQSFSKKRKNLPKKATQVLSDWFFEHIQDPYPSEAEKIVLASKGGLTLVQLNYWFANKRIRYKKKCQEEEARRKEKVHKRSKPSEVEFVSTPQPVVTIPQQQQQQQQEQVQLPPLSPPSVLTPRSTPSSPSKNSACLSSFPIHHEVTAQPVTLPLFSNFSALQRNRNLPPLPGISNFDFLDSRIPSAHPVPVPTFSDQRFPSPFISPRSTI